LKKMEKGGAPKGGQHRKLVFAGNGKDLRDLQQRVRSHLEESRTRESRKALRRALF